MPYITTCFNTSIKFIIISNINSIKYLFSSFNVVNKQTLVNLINMPIRIRKDIINDMGIGLVHYVKEWLENHNIKYDRIETYEFYDEPGKTDGVISHFYVILSKKGSPFPDPTGALLKEAHLTFKIE